LPSTRTRSKSADERDQERKQGKVRGPLHGIPIALKDNIHTTTCRRPAARWRSRDSMPPYEATLTKNLRDAGAIIIAKTNMTELANWVAGAPTPMPGTTPRLGGYGCNPYDPRRDPRDATCDGAPAGHRRLELGRARRRTSGPPTSARDVGSILSPRTQTCSLASSRRSGASAGYGVIPITADQDTAGPMAKRDRRGDLFGALEGAAPDPTTRPRPAARRAAIAITRRT
jgi:Asp-tRNA(Asn)/Glu-tRNA(Gln) amidotransferase A subunit family amidase